MLFDWKEQFRLSLDPERAQELHDESLPSEYFKSAEFCAMCGPQVLFDALDAGNRAGTWESGSLRLSGSRSEPD